MLANVLKAVLRRSSKSGWYFLFKEHTEHLLRYMHNKTIIGFGFSHDSENYQGFGLCYPPQLITQTSALIILAIMLNLIQ